MTKKSPNIQKPLKRIFEFLVSYNSFEKKLEEIRKKRQKLLNATIKNIESDRIGHITSQIEKLY
ncbi:hypothetical protein COT97_05110 [Candidatus Falkowbacteria bacterium CG10_big_fil_rev_8_21_14_0_10_39_11]|uniref:Uncharacterized protein n=1 Tax=Candidatus Falkowbacteria bacterium CG10_big_fil_rev_8_21_14_0_10_39_11 TaxID=1974565 RepID=A0A2H0V3P6_9BACT|nr:MAG: hypothetical protein COT97_05110 [Candidatus Falkowbacteria bacterium CG10_big_fil_rev_8_21_14_0_10_39_11]